MRIGMVGDLVGKPGRNAVLDWAPTLRSEYGVEFLIVDAENAAGGVGITPELAMNLLRDGSIDVLTLGNHAWGKREILPYLDEESRILRPANYPPGAPGRGWGVYGSSQGQVAVIVLQGRTFMEPVDDPFRALDSILESLPGGLAAIFVEFHAEATSEKQAFGMFADGRVSAVVGTHTHVQTADERILPRGTAYLTDVGMTGPIHSVIGMRVDVVLPRFQSLLPSRFEVADGEAQLSAALIDVDPHSRRAVQIERLQIPPYRRTQPGPA
jgi:metallophosphoesterase (TIGR00282 family)